MALYQITGEHQDSIVPGATVWLVVAPNLFEALSTIPDQFAVRSVDVHVALDTTARQRILAQGALDRMLSEVPRMQDRELAKRRRS